VVSEQDYITLIISGLVTSLEQDHITFIISELVSGLEDLRGVIQLTVINISPGQQFV